MRASMFQRTFACSLRFLNFYCFEPSDWAFSKNHSLESVRWRVQGQVTIGNSYEKTLAERRLEPHASCLATQQAHPQLLEPLVVCFKRLHESCLPDSWPCFPQIWLHRIGGTTANKHQLFGEVVSLALSLRPWPPLSRQVRAHRLGVFVVVHRVTSIRSRYLAGFA